MRTRRTMSVLFLIPFLITAEAGLAAKPVQQALSAQVETNTAAVPSCVVLAPPPAANVNARIPRVRYSAQCDDHEARFTAQVSLETTGRNPVTIPLFEGDLAVPAQPLPESLALTRTGNQYQLVASRPGRYDVSLNFVVKVTRSEPWFQTMFTGPDAVAITMLEASAGGADTELEVLAGTVQETLKSNTGVKVCAVLGAERKMSLRWRSKATEAARQALITCDTAVSVLVTPTVMKYTTQLGYEILQGAAARLTVELPASHALTKLQGDQIRDWRIAPEGDHQALTIEFIKPAEKACRITLYSEQTLEKLAGPVAVQAPQPLGIEREAGTLALLAEEMLVEPEAGPELRQVNAPAGTIAAFQFHKRPLVLQARLQRIAPEVSVADRVTARLEETRLLLTHAFSLGVKKAGIYTAEFSPLAGYAVSDVQGDGVEDWKAADGKLTVTFGARVLGERHITVQLEQALKVFPQAITVAPLRLAGAFHDTTQIGVGSAAGIQLRTRDIVGAREIPAASLVPFAGELLGFNAEQPDWSLSLTTEKPAARIVAEIFNLVTVGDGLVGGSAMIRYAVLNQGVQELRVKVPAGWKNVEFTGANIRRKDQQGDLWTISLQEKVWGGYTLVVTYDMAFDPQQATMALGGIHAVDAERETGTLAVSSGPGLQLKERTAVAAAPAQIFRIDESEMNPSDRALVTRSILLSYRYSGNAYDVSVDVMRFKQAALLQAVTDRMELSTVLTQEGQLLTQASFMVKNNDKQFQRFQLPSDADFWSCYVNGQPAKPERDGETVLVPLPRNVNRDQALPVEIVYAQKMSSINTRWPRPVRLAAPHTDVQTTFAEWELFVPPTHTLARFGGNMVVAAGTTYGLRDAWQEFLRFYDRAYLAVSDALVPLIVIGAIVLFFILALRRKWVSVVGLVVVLFVFGILGGLMLPALSSSRERARRISSVNNLKQIGSALRMYADDHGDKLPPALDDLKVYAGANSDQLFIDISSGARFDYVAGGKTLEALGNGGILAYSPPDASNGRNVLYADGHVQYVNAADFSGTLSQALKGLTSNYRAADVSGKERLNAQQPPEDQSWVAGSPVPSSVAESKPVTSVSAGERRGAVVKAAGLKSMRIEVPRSGQRFVFTKVLNVQDEPLSIAAWAVKDAALAAAQGALALLFFLVGLAVAARQAVADKRSGFRFAIGLALIVASVVGVLVKARLLGLAMILLPPVAAVAIIVVWIVQARAKRKARRDATPPAASPAGAPPPLPVAMLALALLSAAGASEAATNPVTIASAEYTGVVTDKLATVEATLVLSAPLVGRDGVEVPLFGPDVAVADFTGPRQVELLRHDRQVAVRISRKGTATIHFKLLVTPQGDISKRELAFGLPPALASRVALTITEPDAEVEVPSAVSFRTVIDPKIAPGGQTRVEAVIGAAERFEMRWTPRIKRATEIAATVFCQNNALVTVGGGTLGVRAVMDYQLTQGEWRELRVRIPADQRLLRVDGPGIQTWQVKEENGENVLSVQLISSVASNYTLTVETEKPLGALPARTAVELPNALGVKRETGLLALRAGEELTLTVLNAEGVQKVDAEEFPRTVSGTQAPSAALQAYRFLGPAFGLTLQAEPVRAQVEVVACNQVRIGRESLIMAAKLDYTIKRAGVFGLRVSVPAGYDVTEVSGADMAQWTVKADAEPRVLDVRLKQRVSGTTTLNLKLYKWFKELPATVEVAGAYPVDMQKLTGFIKVGADLGIQLKAQAVDGLTEVPAGSLADLAGMGGTLAYKFIQDEGGKAPARRLTVTTEAVEPWVRAEVVNRFTLNASEAALVQGRATLRYDIQNAPVREFRLKAPAAARNVDISGENVRRRDQEGGVWRVELQNRVSGVYTLAVTWDQPFAIEEGLLQAAGVQPLGVERDTGVLAIQASAPFQVTEKNVTGDVVRTDVKDLPEWAGHSEASTVLAYRYLRPGYALTLGVQRFQDAEVLNALAEQANLTTVISEDGQMMTELALSVRNNARQYLELALPAGAQVWSAFVNGAAVRPAVREGKLLVPLDRVGGSSAPDKVELTYVGQTDFPRKRGAVALKSPTLDMPLKDAHWEVFLPPDYDYGRFKGTMMYEPEAAPQRQVYAFSYNDYTVTENEKAAQRKTLASISRSRAKKQLAANSYQGAQIAYQQIRQEEGKDGDSQKEIAEINEDLRQVQSVNLMNAQQEFFDNNGNPQEQQRAAPKRQNDVAGNLVAAQQWDRLQQAQEIGVAKVLPLRVNVPRRGVRFAFIQALQTETGKPMTIQFRAVNSRGINLPLGLTAGAGGFILLWLASAMALAHFRKPT